MGSKCCSDPKQGKNEGETESRLENITVTKQPVRQVKSSKNFDKDGNKVRGEVLSKGFPYETLSDEQKQADSVKFDWSRCEFAEPDWTKLTAYKLEDNGNIYIG